MNNFINELKETIRLARRNSYYFVNNEMLKAYFEIGRRIVEEEQKGEKRAGYGQKLLEAVSEELTKEFGRGFSRQNIINMRKFYLVYQIRESVNPPYNNESINDKKIRQSLTGEFKISWTHYCELIKIEDEIKRSYFEKYAITENLSVRDLKRQIYSLHYERLLLSKDKKGLFEYEKKGNIPSSHSDLIKDPYVLDFLGLDEDKSYNEKEIETKILNNLQKFLLELGQGFTFVSRQKRFTIDNDHFYIDLLFYNIYLRCYVVIELKIGKFKHEDVGQMNFYINYVKKELNKEGDNDPIGIILCTEKDSVHVEFATSGISNKMFISKYQLYIPKKEDLEREIRKLL